MLPIYLSGLGVSASHFALIFSLYAATGLVVGQMTGYLADVLFKRTTLLLFLSLLVSLAFALYGFLPASLPWLAAGLVAIALFNSQRIQIYNSIMLDSRRGEELYGRIRLYGSIGFVFVTIIVGWLADQPSLTASVMWPSLVVIELLIVVSLLKLKDVPPAQRLATQPVNMGFWRAQTLLLESRLMRKFLIFVFLCQFAQIPLHILQIKLLHELGSTSVFSTGCVAVAAIAEMFIFYFGSRVFARIRLMPLMAVVPLAVFLRFGMIAAVPSPWVILASNVLHVITFGLNYLACVLFVNREAPPELKSSAQTLLALSFSFLSTLIGNLGASAILGWLTRDGGFDLDDMHALRILFAVGAFVTLFSFLVFLPMKKEYQRKHRVRGFWVRPDGPPPRSTLDTPSAR